MIMETKCPHCGRVNEMVAGRDPSSTPGPGAVSICFRCTKPAVFTETGLRTPTDAEQEQFDQSPIIRAARKAAARALSADEAIREWRADQ